MYEANQGRGRRSNTLVVPQANNALQQLKYELRKNWASPFRQTVTMVICRPVKLGLWEAISLNA